MASLSNIFASIDQARGLYDNISGTLSRDGLSTDSDESDETLPPTQVVAADEYDDGVRIDVDARDIAFENVTGDEVDQWYEPEEPALIRTPDGVELLRTTRERERGARFYLRTDDVRARGYSDFQPLKCGSNGCVYDVYSARERARVALKVGSVSGDEVVRHGKAARANLAPALIDSFPVTVGVFDAQRGFVRDDSQFALVMPLMVPLNDFVRAHGISESLVDAWRALVARKNDARMYHGDWHWGNVVLDVAPARRVSGLAPRVTRMLLIDWDRLASVEGARERTLTALLRLDAVYQYSQFLTARPPASLERQQLAVRGGMLRYFLGEPARSAKTTRAALGQTLRFARQLAVAALNASNGSVDSARIMDSGELRRLLELKFAAYEPIVRTRDARTNRFVYA